MFTLVFSKQTPGICTCCGKHFVEAEEFKALEPRRLYEETGLCLECQDTIFNDEPEVYDL